MTDLRKMIERWRWRRAERRWEQWHRYHRWDALGTYNAERGRGLVHTPGYDAEMARQQAAFDAEIAEERKRRVAR